MAAVLTPPEAPTTRTDSPDWIRPRVVRKAQAVRKTTAAAAAACSSNPSGRGRTLRAGTATAPAYVPRTVSPSRCQSWHKLSCPARQASHSPQPRFPSMTTRCPSTSPLTPEPSAAILPAPSEPGMCGISRLRPGQPSRTHRSAWLRAAAVRRTRTSPGPGEGSGSSWYSRTSGPPWRWKWMVRTPTPWQRFGAVSAAASDDVRHSSRSASAGRSATRDRSSARRRQFLASRYRGRPPRPDPEGHNKNDPRQSKKRADEDIRREIAKPHFDRAGRNPDRQPLALLEGDLLAVHLGRPTRPRILLHDQAPTAGLTCHPQVSARSLRRTGDGPRPVFDCSVFVGRIPIYREVVQLAANGSSPVQSGAPGLGSWGRKLAVFPPPKRTHGSKFETRVESGFDPEVLTSVHGHPLEVGSLHDPDGLIDPRPVQGCQEALIQSIRRVQCCPKGDQQQPCGADRSCRPRFSHPDSQRQARPAQLGQAVQAVSGHGEHCGDGQPCHDRCVAEASHHRNDAGEPTQGNPLSEPHHGQGSQGQR